MHSGCAGWDIDEPMRCGERGSVVRKRGGDGQTRGLDLESGTGLAAFILFI